MKKKILVKATNFFAYFKMRKIISSFFVALAFACLAAFIPKYLHNFFLKDNSAIIQGQFSENFMSAAVFFSKTWFPSVFAICCQSSTRGVM